MLYQSVVCFSKTWLSFKNSKTVTQTENKGHMYFRSLPHGSGPLKKYRWFFFFFLPQKAAGYFNIIIQLKDRAATDGHTVVILDLHRVLNIVRPGHCTAIFDLQQQARCSRDRSERQHKAHMVLHQSGISSHHSSAARVSIGISQRPSVHHRKLLRVNVCPQHFLPVTYKKEMSV